MSASPDSFADIALKSPFFDGLPTDDARSILRTATVRRFFANSVVFNQQERVRSLYLLVEGRARHFYVTPEGRKIIFTLIMPGELFGSAALLPSMGSHVVSVEAITNSRILTWDPEAIRKLAMRHPKLLDNALSVVGAYVKWLVSAHVRLACDSAQLRLAQVIVNLARDVGTDRQQGIELVVTNEELAHAANVTPFTVSRLMGRWHRSGVISKSRCKVLLRDPNRLFQNGV